MSKLRQAVTDEQLASDARKGSSAALSQLLQRMMPELKKQAGAYTLPGLDRDDLVQEGALGVMNAVRYFQPERGAFFPFAVRCARSGMSSAARLALSGKHLPLCNYAPLEGTGESPADTLLQPEEILSSREHCNELRCWMGEELSPYERQVLQLYLSGRSYSDIASLLSSHSKAVDNALQRVRRKLRRFYSTYSVSA